MNVRSTIARLVVLALVTVGIFWASRREPSTARRQAATERPGQGEESLPDVTLAAATADAGGVGITLSLSPNPPVAFAKTSVRVRAESAGGAVPLEGGRVTFEMTMPMGDHRYSLVAGQDGWQKAEVILPRCMSGERRWYATVEGTVAGQPRSARFRLELAPQK